MTFIIWEDLNIKKNFLIGIIKINKVIYFLYYIFQKINKKIIWGLGIGDWGLGIGDWGLGIGPNPQSPIPSKYS